MSVQALADGRVETCTDKEIVDITGVVYASVERFMLTLVIDPDLNESAVRARSEKRHSQSLKTNTHAKSPPVSCTFRICKIRMSRYDSGGILQNSMKRLDFLRPTRARRGRRNPRVAASPTFADERCRGGKLTNLLRSA
jgi:hypothetical protein